MYLVSCQSIVGVGATTPGRDSRANARLSSLDIANDLDAGGSAAARCHPGCRADVCSLRGGRGGRVQQAGTARKRRPLIAVSRANPEVAMGEIFPPFEASARPASVRPASARRARACGQARVRAATLDFATLTRRARARQREARATRGRATSRNPQNDWAFRRAKLGQAAINSADGTRSLGRMRLTRLLAVRSTIDPVQDGSAGVMRRAEHGDAADVLPQVVRHMAAEAPEVGR